MEDFIELSGSFEYKLYKLINGKLIFIEEYKDDNLVVTLGKEKITKLLANDGSNHYISQISFGEDQTAPVVGDSSITNPFTKSLASYEFPTTKSVKFNWTLELTEANGKDIYEYGLICQDATLFARKVSGLIEKESDVLIEGSWTINIL